jgi:rubrerythrin
MDSITGYSISCSPKEVLLRVAREEKTHLDWLLDAFTEKLGWQPWPAG